MNVSRQAEQWLQAAAVEVAHFATHFLKAKVHAFNAGFHLMSARECIGGSGWTRWIEDHCRGGGYCQLAVTRVEIPAFSLRTAFRCLDFAESALHWAREANPSVTSHKRLEELAREMVMQSPKGFIALCRELSLMRRFGEYDEVKYQLNKGKPQQLELDFSYERCVRSLQAIELRTEIIRDLAPSSKLKLRDLLARALEAVNTALNTVDLGAKA